jgi:hypothetical protein
MSLSGVGGISSNTESNISNPEPNTGQCYDHYSGNPGVDVMITIFRDFRQFSAKKLALFSQKPML